MQSTRTCTTDGCDRPHYGRGLCRMHYQRARKAGALKPLPKPSPVERFMSKVDREGPVPAKRPELGRCWEWMAGKSSLGYGMFTVVGRGYISAHRWYYEQLHGEVPRKFDLDHMCHNRGCVNPAHLRPVTRKANCENRKGPRKGNRSGYRGVSYVPHCKKWKATVCHNGEDIYLGLHPTPEAAAEAARVKRNELFTCNDLDRLQDQDSPGGPRVVQG